MVALGENAAGEPCLYALGREHPLGPTSLAQVREWSRPIDAPLFAPPVV